MSEVYSNEILIREATPEDAPRLLEIYAYYVEKTAIPIWSSKKMV